MPRLLFKLLLSLESPVRMCPLYILEPCLQTIDFLLETCLLGIKDQPDCSLLLDQLLNIRILLIDSPLQLHNLTLQALDVLLLVDPHLLDLALVQLAQFDLQAVLLVLGRTVVLEHFGAH